MSQPTETAYEVAEVRGVPTLLSRDVIRRSKTVKLLGRKTPDVYVDRGLTVASYRTTADIELCDFNAVDAWDRYIRSKTSEINNALNKLAGLRAKLAEAESERSKL